MRIMAHVPVQTYGFIEIEGDPSEEAIILEAYNRYAEHPVKWTAGTTKRVKDFFGQEIDWDEANHIYSWNGEKYLSGSEFAKKNQKPFDSVMMSGMVAKKTGADPLEIAKLWERGGKISRDFGTTVHEALEIYGKFKSLSDSLEKEYHLPNHPLLRSIVKGFYAEYEDENAFYEVLVVDHKNKRAGTIDRLVPGIEVGSVIIQDYKITHKEDLSYWKDQLGFYEGIIKANGGKVQSKEIYQYSDAWKKHTL